MRIILIILLILSFKSLSYSQEDSKTNPPTPYYFEGINVWDFDSTGWKPEFRYVIYPDSVRVFFTRKLGLFDISFNFTGYSFITRHGISYNNYAEYYKTFKRKYGKPYKGEGYQTKWQVDSQRTINLEQTTVSDGAGAFINFDWGNYSDSFLQNLRTETLIKLKEQEKEKREQIKLDREKEVERNYEKTKKEREDKEKLEKEGMDLFSKEFNIEIGCKYDKSVGIGTDFRPDNDNYIECNPVAYRFYLNLISVPTIIRVAIWYSYDGVYFYNASSLLIPITENNEYFIHREQLRPNSYHKIYIYDEDKNRNEYIIGKSSMFFVD